MPILGHYDKLMLRMKLRRRDTALVLRVYIPLTVMVIVSWFCFLVDYQSVPARTSMSAALVLTVMTLIASIQQDLPKAPHGRVVDIHMFVCFLYIFAGLVEYSFIRSLVIGSRRANKQQQLKENSKVRFYIQYYERTFLYFCPKLHYYIQSVGIIIYSQLDTVSGPIESPSRAGPGPRAVCCPPLC